MSEIEDALISLPDKAPEAMVDTIFIRPFIKALGFNSVEIYPQYNTGAGTEAVDYALRRNQDDNDIFVETRNNPSVLIEIKGRDINLSEGATQYKATLRQLKRYLLSPQCKSAEWGILTNSSHAQLFRKHGKVIHPASECLEIKADNINDIVRKIKQKIQSPSAALTVAIYNNKGGVGKTTTTVNLAAILTTQGKRVLVVDFDPNQKDLTNYLDVKLGHKTLYSLLSDKTNQIAIKDVATPYSIQFKTLKKTLSFDIIPSDEELGSKSENDLYKSFKISRLKQVLDKAKLDYDYILIDSPPNWRFFSMSAIFAADVVLIPTKHNNLFSLNNASVTIRQYIPEIQEFKKDGTPIALPIFWNGEKISEAAKEVAQKAMDDIIKQSQKDAKPFDLLPYFYPRYASGKDRTVFELPSYANIASATFAKIPSVYKDKTAHDYYLLLAKEYFLQ